MQLELIVMIIVSGMEQTMRMNVEVGLSHRAKKASAQNAALNEAI